MARTCSGLCPFHDDHEPSLVISPKKNLWHCLGACQTGGTVIDWVMKSRGRELPPCGRAAARRHPSLAATGAPVRRHRRWQAAAAGRARRRRRSACCDRWSTYYHETLKQSPEALEYLEKRGLTHPEMIEQLPAGLCQPHAGLPAAGKEPQGRRGDARPLAEARHHSRDRATSTSTGRW